MATENHTYSTYIPIEYEDFSHCHLKLSEDRFANQQSLKQTRENDRFSQVLGWMWISICLNGFILSVVIIGVYVVSLQHYLGVVFLSDILEKKKGATWGIWGFP